MKLCALHKNYFIAEALCNARKINSCIKKGKFDFLSANRKLRSKASKEIKDVCWKNETHRVRFVCLNLTKLKLISSSWAFKQTLRDALNKNTAWLSFTVGCTVSAIYFDIQNRSNTINRIHTPIRTDTLILALKMVLYFKSNYDFPIQATTTEIILLPCEIFLQIVSVTQNAFSSFCDNIA